MRVRKNWTDNEIEKLKKSYLKYTLKECASILNRTIGSVRRRITSIGLKKIEYKKRNKSLYTEESISKAVRKSNNYKEVLINLNLRAAGGNYSIIKKYINKYSINISHFGNKKIKRSCGKLLDEILTKNSTFSRCHLKERLYNAGIKKRECELCGQGEEWQGQKMSLILDHIDGINNNNELGNLRIVCPNCNATLPTHAGKNNIGKRKKMERPSYEQLIYEIEEFGYSAVGRKYEVSDNAVRKWKKNYEINGKEQKI